MQGHECSSCLGHWVGLHEQQNGSPFFRFPDSMLLSGPLFGGPCCTNKSRWLLPPFFSADVGVEQLAAIVASKCLALQIKNYMSAKCKVIEQPTVENNLQFPKKPNYNIP